jgi:PKD repeat protein
MKGFRDGIQMWDPSTGYTSNVEFRVNLGTSAGVWEMGGDRNATYCGLLSGPMAGRTYVRVPAYVDFEEVIELGSFGRVRAGSRFTVGRWEQDSEHRGWVGQDFSLVYKDDADVVRTAEFVGGILVTQYDGLPTTTTPWPTTTGPATTTAAAATTTGAATTTASATTTTQGATTTTQPLSVVAAATPTSGSTPLAIQFSCTPGGGNPDSYSYSWKSTPPGGSIGSTQGFTYTYFNAGSYDVYVTVTDASGNVAESNHLAIQASAPTTTTQGSTTTTTGSSAPTITGVSPASTSHMMPGPITITGTNFTGTTAVKFGTLNASNFTVTSPTSISATPPTTAAGSYPITVTNPSGTSNAAAFSLT